MLTIEPQIAAYAHLHLASCATVLQRILELLVAPAAGRRHLHGGLELVVDWVAAVYFPLLHRDTCGMACIFA